MDTRNGSPRKRFSQNRTEGDPEPICREMVLAALKQCEEPGGSAGIVLIKRLLLRAALNAGSQVWSLRWSRDGEARTQISGQALKTLNEVRYWISLLKETGSWKDAEAEPLDRRAAAAAAMLASGQKARASGGIRLPVAGTAR